MRVALCGCDPQTGSPGLSDAASTITLRDTDGTGLGHARSRGGHARQRRDADRGGIAEAFSAAMRSASSLLAFRQRTGEHAHK